MNGETGRNVAQAPGAVVTESSDRSAEGGAPGDQSDQDLLKDRLAVLDKEKNENWERYLRTAADLENLRKRQKREMDDARLESKGGVLKEILSVVDSLERVLEHSTAQGGTLQIVEGVQLVLRQFLGALERLDVTPIEAAGQPFNPSFHEAISQQETAGPAGVVVQVLQRGYKAGDRLLRPALVVVSRCAPTNC